MNSRDLMEAARALTEPSLGRDAGRQVALWAFAVAKLVFGLGTRRSVA